MNDLTKLNIQKILERFFSKYKFRRFKRRDLLIKPETETVGLFYLKEGAVRQYSISINGEEMTLNIFKKGAMFPIGFIINNSTNTHYYEALSDSEVYIAPSKAAYVFLKENHEVLFDLVSRIYRGLEGYFQKMEYLMIGSAKKRLITELIIYAKRFGTQNENNTLINLKLTEKDLGSQTGLARETVSRELQKLKTKRLVIFNKNILRIESLQRLEEELLSD